MCISFDPTILLLESYPTEIFLCVYLDLHTSLSIVQRCLLQHVVAWTRVTEEMEMWQNIMTWGFPCGTVVKNPPANAGDTGSSPGLGRSHMSWSNWAHAPQLLSLCSRAHEPLLRPRATTTEARTLGARAPQQATAMRSPHTTTKSSPLLPQLEKARTQQRRPKAAKNK